ncbi:MAG: TonB-dependent receptor plug domain-containing protein [Desulfobacterium sp.]|nr:TonB-dependent receptor plug domain-containing protein [Desulfobacterium sp.]
MRVRSDTGTLTGIATSKVPVARTVITADDIAVTPARSIMDLLEVYVPGATFVYHPNGSRFGFRGILGDQNFHYLLLVNGKNMNLKVEDGPFAEIFNRDLSDIQKIEIIRGPGSVTYGPGAIGGVLNIITHDATSSDGFKMGGELNQRYRYQNVHASYGKTLPSGLNCYFSGSYSNSDGEEDTGWYYVDRTHGFGYGYMSEEWGYLNTGTPVSHYYGDALDKPQVKLHAALAYEEWSGWMRYTSGSQYNMQEISVYQDENDFHSQEWDVFAIELKHDHAFAEKWALKTKAGFDSFSYRQISSWQGTDQPQENILQYRNNYSENEYNIQSTLSYAHSDRFKYAAGAAYSYESYGPRWGEAEDEFLMDLRPPVGFASLEDSSAFYQEYGPGAVTVIDAPHLATCSFLMEANLKFHKYAQLILSGRADKHELSTWAYSPRIALITELTKHDILKTVWQRSVRTPNMGELYVADHENTVSPEHEILENYELIFSHTKENFSWNSYLYHNILDEVQWVVTKDTSDVVGQLKMWGFETEIEVKRDDWRVGANYSHIKQDSWEWLDATVIPTQDLSNDVGGKLTIPDYAGNRINNFPSNAIKVFWTQNWTEALSSHLNGRFYWDQNQKKLLNEYLEAHGRGGTAETKAEMGAIYDEMTDHGYGEPSFTLNASVTWKLPIKTDMTLTLYAMNLISHNNLRYKIQFYEDILQEYSRQSSFIDEPVFVGIKLEIVF